LVFLDGKKVKTNRTRQYIGGTFFLNLPLVVHTIISLFTLPVVLSNVSVDAYGKWHFLLAIQVWIFAITADNITRATKRGITKDLDGTFIHGFTSRLKLVLPVSIILCFVAITLAEMGYDLISYLVFILAGYLLFGYLFQVSAFEFLIAKKRFKEWAYWHISVSLISLTSSAITVYFTHSIIYFALTYFSSVSLVSVAMWYSIARRWAVWKSYRSGAVDRECVKYGIRLIPVELINATAGKISHLFIIPLFGYMDLAVFAVADKLRERTGGVFRSIRSLFYADFARTERESIAYFINRHLLKVFLFSLILTVIILIIVWLYIRTFLPHQYLISFLYFAILSIGMPAAIMGIVLHTVLEAHLRYKELTVVGVVASIAKIILVVLLGYLAGVSGVCIAVAISAWIAFGFYYLLTVKYDFMRQLTSKFPLSDRFANF
jgi:O-antigen/teichoic acid export membrane protein